MGHWVSRIDRLGIDVGRSSDERRVSPLVKLGLKVVMILVGVAAFAYVALCLLIMHGHRPARPQVTVTVADAGGTPVSGALVAFVDHYHISHWEMVSSRPDLLDEMKKELGQKEQLGVSDDSGHAVVVGSFSKTSYLWHTYLDHDGALYVSKDGFLSEKIEFKETKYRRGILQGQLDVEVILKEATPDRQMESDAATPSEGAESETE